MKSINIKLDSVEKVKSFVEILNKYDGDFDLVSDKYVIDAKSIMGIFSLDLKNSLRLDIHGNSNFDNPEEILKEYLYKE